jgi:phosphosulfolactate synthase (CoM biosynthesis protein A)
VMKTSFNKCTSAAPTLILHEMIWRLASCVSLPRAVKPRETGLTICADRGLGMNRVADLLETSKEYFDFIKIGKGSYRLQTEEFLKRKIAAYRTIAIR